MSLTDQDRDSIRVIAGEIGKEMQTALPRAMTQMIEHHQATCPHGRRLLESKWFLAGVVVVVLVLTAGGSAVGQILLKLLTGA